MSESALRWGRKISRSCVGVASEPSPRAPYFGSQDLWCASLKKKLVLFARNWLDATHESIARVLALRANCSPTSSDNALVQGVRTYDVQPHHDRFNDWHFHCSSRCTITDEIEQVLCLVFLLTAVACVVIYMSEGVPMRCQVSPYTSQKYRCASNIPNSNCR